MSAKATKNGGGASSRRSGAKKGAPCEFINPPNNLLAKVTHNPALKRVVNLTDSKFKMDSKRLEEMDTLIADNHALCVDALNEKIRLVEPMYSDLQKGMLPEALPFAEQLQDIYAAAKALDHMPVIRITTSMLRYLEARDTKKPLEPAIISAHLDALFNRSALDVRLDAPTKLVLTALETLVDHSTGTTQA